MSHFDLLPTEMLCRIFDYLNRVDITVGHLTCQLWHELLPKMKVRNFPVRAAMTGCPEVMLWATQLGAKVGVNLLIKPARTGQISFYQSLLRTNAYDLHQAKIKPIKRKRKKRRINIGKIDFIRGNNVASKNCCCSWKVPTRRFHFLPR